MELGSWNLAHQPCVYDLVQSMLFVLSYAGSLQHVFARTRVGSCRFSLALMRNYSFSATRLSAGQHAPHRRVGTVQQFCEQEAADNSCVGTKVTGLVSSRRGVG
jgi:hypothetical protein